MSDKTYTIVIPESTTNGPISPEFAEAVKEQIADGLLREWNGYVQHESENLINGEPSAQPVGLLGVNREPVPKIDYKWRKRLALKRK